MADQPLSRWKLALVLLLGLAIGAGSAVHSMKRGGLRGAGSTGWHGNAVTGSVDADPWTRARVALTGLLALNKSQAIYFTTQTDDSGARLSERCRYRVSGGALPARWWSVTVYADDDYLPQNEDDALSFDATEVKPDARAQWSALVASKPEPGLPWASSNKAGDYTLTLRLYNPTKAAQEDFGTIPLPKVTKLDCGGAA